MADATVTPTLVSRWSDGHSLHLVASLAVGASPATYPTGGLALDLIASSLWVVPVGVHPLPGITVAPIFVRAEGIAGYKYEYDLVNKKLIIRSVPAMTPAGTISQPSFTVKNGSIGSNMTIGLTADAVTASLVGGSGITADRSLTTNNPVGAPTLTGSAIAAAALAELANGSAIPAGVSGDTIQCYAIFRDFQ